jgi:hypothetical protein
LQSLTEKANGELHHRCAAYICLDSRYRTRWYSVDTWIELEVMTATRRLDLATMQKARCVPYLSH